jgi:hypothetical protein
LRHIGEAMVDAKAGEPPRHRRAYSANRQVGRSSWYQSSTTA